MKKASARHTNTALCVKRIPNIYMVRPFLKIRKLIDAKKMPLTKRKTNADAACLMCRMDGIDEIWAEPKTESHELAHSIHLLVVLRSALELNQRLLWDLPNYELMESPQTIVCISSLNSTCQIAPQCGSVRLEFLFMIYWTENDSAAINMQTSNNKCNGLDVEKCIKYLLTIWWIVMFIINSLILFWARARLRHKTLNWYHSFGMHIYS